MKKNVLMIISALFCGMMLTNCEMQGYPTEELHSDPAEELNGDPAEELNGEISYPKFGKYGLNILADDFLEATQTGDTPAHYSVSADLSAGNSSLKIVIKSAKPAIYGCYNQLPSRDICGAKFTEWHEKCPVCGGVNTLRHFDEKSWGGFYYSNLDNWLATNYDLQLRGNIFTVYESGKPAHAEVTFSNDCIIEYYENGAKTPTKVKEIKVDRDVITEEPQEEIPEGLDGVITYPKNGKYGPNILADGFVEAKASTSGRFEYSVRAELTAGNSHFKIVIKSAKPIEYICRNIPPSRQPCGAKFNEWHEICPVCGGVNTMINYGNSWGGWNYGSSEDNWLVSNVGSQFTCKVYDSSEPADASVLFDDDCIIEYYENGAKTPTKVKQIKVIP